MKTKVFILLFCLTSINYLFSQNTAKTVFYVGKLVTLKLEGDGKEIVRLEYDIVSSSNSTKTTARNFSSDYNYDIAAFVAEGVKKFKLVLMVSNNDEWKEIETSFSEGNVAVIKFRPKSSDLYVINFVALEFETNITAAYFGLIVSHDMGKDKKSKKDGNSDFEVLNIKCNKVKTGVWENNDIKILSEGKSTCLFQVTNGLDKVTKIESGVKTQYKVKSSEKDKDGNLVMGLVTNDNKTLVFTIYNSDKSIFIIEEKNKKVYITIYWFEEIWTE